MLVLFAGLLCTLGNICLIKAINLGELSVLGPINSYKSIIGLIFAFISQIFNNQPYLMLHDEKGISLDKIETDANCYILLKSKWNIVSFTNELYNTNSYYLVDYDEYENEKDCFDEIDQNAPLYFIMDCSYIITDEIKKEMEEDPDSLYKNVYSEHMIYEDDVINHYESLNNVEKLELVGEDCIFDRPIKIYKIHLN